MHDDNYEQDEPVAAEIEKEAKRQGKASYIAWTMAKHRGKDPAEFEREIKARSRQSRLAYSDYVRYDGKVHADQIEKIHSGGNSMSQPALTIENMKELLDSRFTAEREYTKALIKEGTDHVIEQFDNFINENFDPTMKKIDQRFDLIEDHLDHLDIDVATLRTDVRHIKQVLQIKTTTPA